MRILPISNINGYYSIKPNKNAFNGSSVRKLFVQRVTPSSENIKANFCPAFGKYKKAGNVMLIDKEDGTLKSATLKREKYGKDFISYKLFVNGEEAGYMDMNCSSVFPEDDNFVLTEPDNVIPEIEHIRSLAGNKYAGIGSALVNAAINESISRGKNGCLWLRTEKGYAWSLSEYRANENPIPFYYKLGFKAPDVNIDKLISRCLEKSDYKHLPDSALLLLTSEAVKQKNKYFASHFNYG